MTSTPAAAEAPAPAPKPAPVNKPEIWGVAEIYTHLGVSRARVSQFRQKPDFPAPHAVLSCGPIWLADTVRKWHKGRVIRPAGRPPKEVVEGEA